MRRLIIAAICVSLAFVGIGTIADTVAGKIKSDEKALDIIRKARTAIGGDDAIAGVRSFVIKGQTSKTVSVNGAERLEQGETEIVFEAPNKMMKMIKIGDHAAGADAIVEKNVDVVVVGGPGEARHKVILEGKDGEFTTENGDKLRVRKIEGGEGEAKVFVRKKADGEVTLEDADVKEIATADGKKFTIVRKGGDGAGEWKSEDGKKMTFERKVDAAAHGGVRDNELLRLTLSLLLTAPDGMDVSYSFAGETTVDGNAANAVLASFGGADVKLYFDRSTNLPLAMSYVRHPSPVIMKLRKGPGDPSAVEKDVVTFERKLAKPETQAEHFVRFSDYRNTNGVLLPYKWTTTVAGKQSDVFDVSSYDVNPANIGERFKGDKVMIRTKKASQN